MGKKEGVKGRGRRGEEMKEVGTGDDMRVVEDCVRTPWALPGVCGHRPGVAEEEQERCMKGGR